ncbi:MAG: energy-coupling factor transporter transmembrane component T [Acidimicrobiales bacterium]|jgi:energy-coupling factor transport system permease protein
MRWATRPAPGRRGLHPGAWWLWAACLAGAASRTTNPILLLLIACVAGYVVSARRTSAPWARSIVVFIRLGIVVIVLRVVLVIVFGDRLPGHVLFTLPHVPLPSWAAGVSIGGPVTAESVLEAAVLGLRLAVVLVCFGAANSLASPYRLLRCLPAVLYEAGVAITVSLSFAPELVVAIGEVRDARRLRGRPVRGLSGLRGMAVPVLESAFDRSLQLASSMDARGYGRRVPVSKGARRWATGSTAAGLLLIVGGVYGVLVAGSLPGGGIPFVAVGAVLVGVGLAAGGRRTNRTRYRPDPWRNPEWLVSGSGVAVVACMVTAGLLGAPGLQFSVYPLGPPTLPILAAAGILIGLAPAWLAPVERGNPAAPRARSARPPGGAVSSTAATAPVVLPGGRVA